MANKENSEHQQQHFSILDLERNIGAVIKRERKRRGFSQEDLAEALNYSDSTVSAIEKGQRTPTLSTILGICDFLNITPNVLFGYEDKEPTDLSKFQFAERRFLCDVMEAFLCYLRRK